MRVGLLEFPSNVQAQWSRRGAALFGLRKFRKRGTRHGHVRVGACDGLKSEGYASKIEQVVF